MANANPEERGWIFFRGKVKEFSNDDSRMNPIEHDGEEFRIVRGGDIQRDGMYLELWSARHPDVQLFEIFYSDADRRMRFASFSRENVPVEVVAEFLRLAQRHLI